MTSELVTMLGDTEVGRVGRDRHGRLSFVYEEKWRHTRRAYPISLSMPLALAEHGHRVVDAFLWGLLPDNEIILERWARRFQVSARSAKALCLLTKALCLQAKCLVRLKEPLCRRSSSTERLTRELRQTKKDLLRLKKVLVRQSK